MLILYINSGYRRTYSTTEQVSKKKKRFVYVRIPPPPLSPSFFSPSFFISFPILSNLKLQKWYVYIDISKYYTSHHYSSYPA